MEIRLYTTLSISAGSAPGDLGTYRTCEITQKKSTGRRCSRANDVMNSEARGRPTPWKHEQRCGGRKREEVGRRHGGESSRSRPKDAVRSTIISKVGTDRERQESDRTKRDERKRKATDLTEGRKEKKIISKAGPDGSYSEKGIVQEEQTDMTGRDGGPDSRTAVVHPSQPRPQRLPKWPVLQQLVDLGSPFSERSVSADREIRRAEEEKTIGRQVYQHSASYTLTEGVSLLVSTKRVVYPDGRVFRSGGEEDDAQQG